MNRTRVIKLLADYRMPNGVVWFKGARAQMHSGVASSLIQKGIAEGTNEPVDPSRGKKRETKRRANRQDRNPNDRPDGSADYGSGT